MFIILPIPYKIGTTAVFCTANQNFIGDGYCDDQTNNEECGYDGGDCCMADGAINLEYCNDCLCLEGGGSNNTATTIYSNSTNQPGTTTGKYQWFIFVHDFDLQLSTL